MNPSIPRRPEKDPALRREAERHVSASKDLLSGHGQIPHGKIERSRHLLIKALGLNPGTINGRGLLVAAVALSATHDRCCLPSGSPDPYCVFGLDVDPAAPTARDPAVIESYYCQASDLLSRCSHPLHPCYPAFTHAARLVADAWAVLSDADLKASLDSRFEEAPQLMLTPPPSPPQPSAPPTAQGGQQDMGRGKRSVGRGKRSVPVTSPPATTRRPGLRVREHSNNDRLDSGVEVRVPDDMGHGKRQKKSIACDS